jgi:acetyl esterase/lipase
MLPAGNLKQKICAILGLLILLEITACTAAAEVLVQTHTYKRVGDLEIKADVHRNDDTKVRPVIVWIHGGALIMGGREGVMGRIKKMFLDAGYVIVSIDYRLSPETKLPAVIEDVEGVFRWIREEGPELFNIDSSRVAVLGGSAGGYLTLVTGHRALVKRQWDQYGRPSIALNRRHLPSNAGCQHSTPSETTMSLAN